MKAAILHQLGHTPVYGDFADPTPQGADDVVITVKAASIKNIDRSRAKGTHYDNNTNRPWCPV